MANPFVLGNNSTAQILSDTLEEFTELAWDFNKNCFIYNQDGSHKIVTRNEAIKVWVYKTLATERHRYGAYFSDYGIEIEEKFIGKVANDTSEVNELFQYIKEALLVNPYILSVSNLNFTQEYKTITLHIDLTTVYGKSTISIEV